MLTRTTRDRVGLLLNALCRCPRADLPAVESSVLRVDTSSGNHVDAESKEVSVRDVHGRSLVSARLPGECRLNEFMVRRAPMLECPVPSFFPGCDGTVSKVAEHTTPVENHPMERAPLLSASHFDQQLVQQLVGTFCRLHERHATRGNAFRAKRLPSPLSGARTCPEERKIYSAQRLKPPSWVNKVDKGLFSRHTSVPVDLRDRDYVPTGCPLIAQDELFVHVEDTVRLAVRQPRDEADLVLGYDPADEPAMHAVCVTVLRLLADAVPSEDLLVGACASDRGCRKGARVRTGRQ